MYAIVQISGKQYKVQENQRVYVPRLAAETDSKVSFDDVLLVSGDAGVQVGTPLVEGASVTATVLGHVRADKVLVFKKKRRKRYRVKNGHRQPYSQILVESVVLGGKKKKKKAAKPAAAPKAEAEVVAPVEVAPAAVAPKKAAPKAEAPKKAAPKAEAPKKAAPKAEAPKKAAPKAEAPKKAAPKAEAPKKAAPKKAASKKAAGGDDLKKIEGIGPKISEIMTNAGIGTFKKMAAADVENLKEILAEAGSRYNRAVPDTWPEQASLAAKGEWDALQKLQDELDGGRRAES